MASPDSQADPNLEDDLPATYAGAKRRIAALEQQIKTLQEAGSKKKT